MSRRKFLKITSPDEKYRLVERHRDGNGDFYTSDFFWECACPLPMAIHPKIAIIKSCARCGQRRDESPDARVEDILKYKWELGLHPSIAQELEEGVKQANESDVASDSNQRDTGVSVEN